MSLDVQNMDPWKSRPDEVTGTTNRLKDSDYHEALWKPFHVDSTLGVGGALANVPLVAGAVGKLIEFMVLEFDVYLPLTAVTPQSIDGTFQDDTDVAVNPATDIHKVYMYDIATPFLEVANLFKTYYPHGAWAITVTSGAGLEIDYAAGGAGAALQGTQLHLSGIWRYVDA